MPRLSRIVYAAVAVLVCGVAGAGHVTQVDMDLAEGYDPTTCTSADASAAGCEGGTSCGGSSCANDDDTSSSCAKIGKDYEVLRLDYDEDQANLTTSDHIDITGVGCHQVDDLTILPYNSATAVCSSTSSPNCHIDVACADGTMSFTLTTDFINNLDGSGAFAIRVIVTDSDSTCSSGDLNYAEVDSFITVGGGPSAKRRVHSIQ